MLAMPIPVIEIRHVTQSGRDKLYVNIQYILADEAGELHPPKNGERREMAMSDEMTTAARAKSC